MAPVVVGGVTAGAKQVISHFPVDFPTTFLITVGLIFGGKLSLFLKYCKSALIAQLEFEI